MVSHGFEKHKVVPFILSQLFGAFAAAALIYGLYHQLFIDYELTHNLSRDSVDALTTASIFSTFPHKALSFWGAFGVEFVITAVLMFAILALGDENNGAPRSREFLKACVHEGTISVTNQIVS